MRSNHGVTIAIASGLALGAFGTAPAVAQEVIDGGQTVSVPGTQASPWNIGNTLTVGSSGVGTLDITAGGTVTNTEGQVGVNDGSSGIVTVTGPSASWTNAGNLFLGYGGEGTLTIANGGTVSSTLSTFIGRSATGVGAVTVTGAGSTLTSTPGGVFVGYGGRGTLDILDGGAVISRPATIGDSVTGSGEVLVSGAGSTWTIDVVSTTSLGLAIGNQGSGLLTINDGGATNVGSVAHIGSVAGASGALVVDSGSWTDQGLYVGQYGQGTLTITGGGTVDSYYGHIGRQLGATGTVTVSGAGSTWTTHTSATSVGLYIGNQGTGTLAVSDGGAVSTAEAHIGSAANGSGTLTVSAGGSFDSVKSYIGYAAGSTGTVAVTGSGSTWTSTGTMAVGNYGTGSLGIADQGAVSTTTIYVGAFAGSSGTLSIADGATLTTRQNVFVGEKGDGALVIENGGRIVNTSANYGDGYVAHSAGSTGTARITGAGSSWENAAYLMVGASGTGTLLVEDGGAVTSGIGMIGYSVGSSGIATLTGSGSSWTSAGSLNIGYEGTGTLSILDGATASNTYATIGSAAGASGTVTVDNASWINSSTLYVGQTGTGALTISEGGTVSNSFGYVGYASGSSGTVTVTDAGSNWTSSSQLQIGRGGDGALSILNGATVSSVGGGFIGVDATGTGTVTVDGAGSVWTSSNNILPGYRGTGTLTISGGGMVENPNGFIAAFAGSTGVVTVTGPGSTWSNTNTIHVGYQGTGTLSIVDSGYVAALGAGVTVAEISGSTGTLEVASGGLLETFALTAGSGAAQVTFDGGKLLALGDNRAFITGFSAGALDISTDGLTLDTAGYTVATDQSGFSGVGAFTKSGSGTLIFLGGNSYASGTTINEGTLQIGDGGTTGSTIGDVAANAALVFNRSDDIDFSGMISGGGTVAQAGTGILTLVGDSSGFGGATSVAAGTLMVDGSLGGTVDVASGALLGGIGAVEGIATISSGGTLIGRQGETLHFGSDLVLADGAVVDVSLGTPGTTGLFDVAGNLTIDGQLDITDLGGFGPGLYRLFDYAGALTDNGLAIGTLPAGITASDLFVQTSVAQQVNLVNTSGVTLNYWDGDDTSLHNNGVVDGGDGVWNLANPNWTDSGGAFDAPWADGSFAIFTGKAGTVTVDASLGALTISGAQFATDGYRIQGDPITLALPRTTLRVGIGSRSGASVTAIIASELTGSGGLEKTDFGTLILTGANSYTGGTFIDQGTLQLGDGGASGSILGDVVDNGIFAIDRSDSFTFAGAISGTGGFLQAGAGTTILTADNSYSGGTAITAGTLQIGNGGTTGSITGDVVNNAALAFNRSDLFAFGGAISGTGSVTQSGAGTTVLTADSSYSGGTTIAAGTLQIGDGGTTGSITGDIANNTALVFDRSDMLTLSGAISGAGYVTQAGAGTTILTGTGSYTGGTTIAAGTLQLGDGGATGSITGDVTNNGALIFRRSNLYSFAGTISGAGSVIQAGTGTTALTAANSYSGGTLIEGGTLAVASDANLGAASGGLIFDGGTLLNSAAFTSARAITLEDGGGTFQTDADLTLSDAATGRGELTKTGSGALILTGTSSYTGGTVIAAGTLQLGNGGAGGAITGDVTNGGTLVFNRSDALSFAGEISGIGSLVQLGTGTTTLTGISSYTGSTRVEAGTLILTAPSAIALSPVWITAGATYALDFSGGPTGILFENTLSGAGLMRVDLGDPTSFLVFGSNVGSAFTGTVALGRSSFDLAGDNTAALTNATLRLDAGNTSRVDIGTQAIGNLALNGGTLVFPAELPSDALSPGIIQTGTLTLTSGAVGVTIPRPAAIPGGGSAPSATLLQQDDTVTVRLVQASSVVGSASSLTLVDQNGAAVDQADIDIERGGNVVAIGSYGYNLTSGAANDGLYVAYGLSRLDLQAGRTLTLSGDDGTAAGSELHALVTGSGGLAIAAADTITLSNAANDYTGTTQVLAGTLALGTDHALGLTSLLTIDAGATADINGRTQAVGALDVRGTLALDGGNLSVANGGTSTGMLSGGGSLNLTGGSLAIRGANAQLSASVAIASGAAVVLTDVQGLGTGAIADAGMLTLDGASGTFANALSGTGSVALTDAASVTLGGNNSAFSGLFAIAQGASLTASLPQHLGTAAIQDNGNLILDTASDWTFANIVSGTGALTKAGSGTLIVTGTNSYAGGTTIAAGTLQLGDGGTAGSIPGDVVDNGMLVFDRSDTVTFAGAISGSGSLAQRGTGTTILTGANSYAGATQVETGTLTLAAPSAVASGPVSIAAGATYALDFSTSPASFVFGNALTGSGLMRVDLGDAANAFAFGSNVGSAFAGTVALGRSSFTLSGDNSTALTNATLRLDAGNVTTVGAGTPAIGNLTFNGGTAVFPVALPPDTISSGLISTGILTLTSGTVEAAVPEQAPATWSGIGPASTLLQQDDMIVAQLIAAQSVVGSASSLALADNDASGVEEALVDIVQNGNVVAIGSYGYNLTTGLDEDGLYVAYGLSQLDLQPGQTLTLLGDDGTEAGSELHALVTGSGNLAIAATDTITLSNTANDYTGTTRVATGTLALGADRVLGLTSLLAVDVGATADINGMTQEVGAIDISGTLALGGGALATSTALGAGTLRTSAGGNVALGGGTLTIVNGGATAANTLSGAGSLDLTGGTLAVDGANARLGASIAIAQGAAATLTNTQGLGTGPIADAGTLSFAGASGTFANALSGTGSVALTDAASVTLDGNNSGFSGRFAIAQGTSLTASLPQHLGGSTVQDDGRLIIDTDTDWALANRVIGTGSLTKQGSGILTITANETYSGGTIVSEGTLIVGTPTSTDAALSGGGDTYVAPGATLGGYGRVHGTVTNEGTIAVRDALVPFAGQSKGAFTINSGLVNNALAQIGGGGIGNRLIVSNYVGGAGSIVAINTELGDDASPSDMLVIDGGTATGSSGLRVTNIGGEGALTTGDGIRVVDAINGATTVASAFGLVSPVVAGPYEYSLHRGGLAAGENWYLRSALDCSLAPDSVPCLSTEEEEAPDYRREDSLYAALPSLTLLYGSELIATLHERSGMRAPLSSASGPAIWGRVVGGREKHDGDPLGIYGSGPAFDYDSVVYQAGIDYHRAEHDRLGVYFAYGRLGSNVDHYTGGFAGDARLKAYTIGHYWTHVGAGGWYIDGVVQGTRYDLKASSHRGLADLETNGHGFAASLEGGYPIRLSSDWSLEPQAQIVFQKVSLDSASDGVSTVRFRDIRSIAGRIGLRLSHDFAMNPDAAEGGSGRGTWWLRADLWNEFENDPVTRFSSDDGPVDLDSDLGGFQLRLTTAVSAEVAKGIDLYAGGNLRYRLDGDSWGYQGSIGLKIVF